MKKKDDEKAIKVKRYKNRIKNAHTTRGGCYDWDGPLYGTCGYRYQNN